MASRAPWPTSISMVGMPLTRRFTTTNGTSAWSRSMARLDSRGLHSSTPSTCLVRVWISSSSTCGSSAAELLAIAEELRHHDIELELLNGPLQGLYNPSGHGAALFAFFAGMAESEREYVREKSLEGQASARERGRHGGRPKVFDDDMLAYARSLRERGVPVPDIAAKLVIPTGKNKGRHPSVASVHRMLAESGGTDAN